MPTVGPPTHWHYTANDAPFKGSAPYMQFLDEALVQTYRTTALLRFPCFQIVSVLSETLTLLLHVLKFTFENISSCVLYIVSLILAVLVPAFTGCI